MTFAITFKNRPVPKDWLIQGSRAELAEIQINDFVESLSIITNYWSREDYIRQWMEAVDKLGANQKGRSALITQFLNSSSSSYVAELWSLYRDGDMVYIQNYYVQPNEVTRPVTAQKIYNSLRKRSKNVSEWSINIEDLRQWSRGLCDLLERKNPT